MQEVSREALYAQVWASPMTQVAALYGVTGTALKKTCDRHDIPTPERGYWARLQHGKQVAQEPLPAQKDGRLAKVRIAAQRRPAVPEAVLAATARAPDMPAAGAGLYDKPERFARMDADLEALKTFVRGAVRK